MDASMTAPLVTVVTATFNDARFIHLPIESVLSQTYENVEMIVVDDGSTDPASLAILGAINHPKITLVRQPNKGLPGARNTGIRAGKGDYILPLDADDKISQTCLRRSVDVLNNNPACAVVYGALGLFGSDNRVIPAATFNTYRLLFSNFIPVGSMFRREAWESVGGYTEEMEGFEDWEFWLKLVEKGWKFKKIDDVMFFHHQHGTSMWNRTRGVYKKVVAHARSLHPELYTKESRGRLKKENRITWFEDLIYHIPLPLRRDLGRSPVRRLLRGFNALGLYRDL
jgi:glycosyltransferase involved in cell wall biosynthesis